MDPFKKWYLYTYSLVSYVAELRFVCQKTGRLKIYNYIFAAVTKFRNIISIFKKRLLYSLQISALKFLIWQFVIVWKAFVKKVDKIVSEFS